MLYKYCNVDGFDIVKNSRLRLSRFDSFNDPFELAFGIDERNAEFDLRKEYEDNSEIIYEWANTLDSQFINYDKTSSEDLIQKFIQFQTSQFKKIPMMMWEEWSQKHGVICLSESMDVIQMWAHYADNHKGIVIGIEEREFVTDRETIITVCYRDKMVLFPVTGHPQKLDQYAAKYIPEVLARKETNWSYEKEIRFYGGLGDQEIDGHYYLNIPSSAIKELYLGLRADNTTAMIATELKNREEYEHLKVFTMLQDTSAFNLVSREEFNG